MATEKEARQAAEQYATTLKNLAIVLGIGVVPLGNETNSEFAVAIYVDPVDFATETDEAEESVIPATLEFQSSEKLIHVPTKIVELSQSVLQ